jgi:hypothetical protein
LVYIGDRSLINAPWLASSARELTEHGLGVLPTYAAAGPFTEGQGTADGDETASLLRAFEIAAGAHVALDLEPVLFRGNPDGARSYARAWCKAVRDAGWRPTLYCTPDGDNALSADPDHVPDAVLVSVYPRPTVRWGPPSTADLLIDTACPPHRGWQYTNEIPLIRAGINVDMSVVNFPLAGAPEVTSTASGGHFRAAPVQKSGSALRRPEGGALTMAAWYTCSDARSSPSSVSRQPPVYSSGRG